MTVLDVAHQVGIPDIFLQAMMLSCRKWSALFREGVLEGKVIWEDYVSYLTDPYGKSFSFKPILSEQLLRQSWSVFSKLWQDDDDRDFLTSMTHWYLEANGHSPFTEGSIIMAQTALELAYNWLLIENKNY